jgi:hypothetical protein
MIPVALTMTQNTGALFSDYLITSTNMLSRTKVNFQSLKLAIGSELME